MVNIYLNEDQINCLVMEKMLQVTHGEFNEICQKKYQDGVVKFNLDKNSKKFQIEYINFKSDEVNQILYSIVIQNTNDVYTREIVYDYYDGYKFIILDKYLLNGKLHNEFGPAFIIRSVPMITNEITKKYYINGKLHREKKPAVITENNDIKISEQYYMNNKVHREDGPAFLRYNTDVGGSNNVEYTRYVVNDEEFTIVDNITSDKLMSVDSYTEFLKLKVSLIERKNNYSPIQWEQLNELVEILSITFKLAGN